MAARKGVLAFAAIVGAIAAAIGAAGAATAQTIFVPPNDPVGHVFTTNSNDGWDGGRGIVFQVGSTQTLSSIGLYQDLTGAVVHYEVDQTTSASGNLGTGKVILRSGSGTFTTSGLQFITFAITPLTLTAGSFYQIRFDFSENSNQNFFYDNDNVTFSQAGLNLIDGTSNDDAGNSVMPRIEINATAVATAVPALAPMGLALLGLLLACGALVRLRRR